MNLIDKCNCSAARKAVRIMTQLYDKHLIRAGLTINQFMILSVIADEPMTTMAILSTALVMERTTLLRALKPLERDGLVEVFLARDDRRSHVYNLSRSGKTKLASATQYWETAQKEFETLMGRENSEFLRTKHLEVAGN